MEASCRYLAPPSPCGYLPDRSWQLEYELVSELSPASLSRAKLDLYDRYHAYQAEAKAWPVHGIRDAASYLNSFVINPFPTQEWCYYLGSKLVGVGYVDLLPDAVSAIYFFYDPK